MKLILDLGALQGENRRRGIGRVSLSLARALIKQGAQHDIQIVLNHSFPETLDEVRNEFMDLIEPERILIWQSLLDVAEANEDNRWRCRAAELIRERYIQDLSPDLVHISSLFEGYTSDNVVSIGCLNEHPPTAVTLYDLIPYLNQDLYLGNPNMREWYLRKLSYLRKSDLLLAISESTRNEALEALGVSEDRMAVISIDADSHFREINPSDSETQALRQRYNLARDFILYTGGIDPRKNVEGLIEAYGLLPGPVRQSHHLMIVCELTDDSRRHLENHCRRAGLKKEEVILTGYVSDADLVLLYNLCKLFVFPSFHEGFGLPVLEAMRCGAPVIGSNRSNIPEVVGLDAALFDPGSVHSISEKMAQALNDENFMRHLCEHSRNQAKKFSWESSAKKALMAFEAHVERKKSETRVQAQVIVNKPKLAYLSPLPPERSGIADYSAELLPELATYYDIDLITALDKIADPYLEANFHRRSIAEFEEKIDEYDRIIYQMGNSNFHSKMLPLLERHPGTIVLHDFFLSGLFHFLGNWSSQTTMFREQLYYSHGYPGLQRLKEGGAENTVWELPASRTILDQAQGVVVHSEYSKNLARIFYGPQYSKNMDVIPTVRKVSSIKDKNQARTKLSIPHDAFLVCSFGILGATKLNLRLLNSWLSSALSKDKNCFLIYVGDADQSQYNQALRHAINHSEGRKRIRITGYVDHRKFENYLAASDACVQLRTKSRGESSRTVLDCLSHGLSTIVNANGSFAELPDDAVFRIPDEFADQDLTEAVEKIYHDEAYRNEIGAQGRAFIKKNCVPKETARKYFDSIEGFASGHLIVKQKNLIRSIENIEEGIPSGDDFLHTAIAISENQKRGRVGQLFVDISELVKGDFGAGIQRVVHRVIGGLLEKPPNGFRVEPVYRLKGTYFYARRFITNYLGLGEAGIVDSPIEVCAQDIFLGLDLDLGKDDKAHEFLLHHKQRGLKIYFVVYDLLPVLLSHCFPPEGPDVFNNWLNKITQLSNGVACISESVAGELKNWIKQQNILRLRPMDIQHFQLGADYYLNNSIEGLKAEEEQIISQLNGKNFFLMVGTLEPRKGHDQVIDAMEYFWDSSDDLALVIVGKQGWMVESVVTKLREHSETGKRLLWIQNVSDKFLCQVYDTATALLMASMGEGYGLPLMEAAHHGLPIICRDIPAFREVASNHAYYFSGDTALDLKNALDCWLALFNKGQHPQPEGIDKITWKQSEQQLLDIILKTTENN